MHLAWHGLEHVLKELGSRLSVSSCNELSDGELGCAVNANEQIQLALGGLHLGDVELEEADGVAFELLALRLVAFDIRQARDTVTLQTAVQRRPVRWGIEGCRA